MSDTTLVKKYAIVKDNIVVQTIYTNPGFMEMLQDNSVIDVTEEPNERKTYSIVKDSIVVQTLYTEPGFLETLQDNSIIDITDEPNAGQITEGYVYDNSSFSAPIA